MQLRLLLLLFLPALCLAGEATHSAFPVDIKAGPAPVGVSSGGHRYLVYELHITNFYGKPVQLKALHIYAEQTLVQTLEGAALLQRLGLVGADEEAAPVSSIPGGGSAIIFADIELPDSLSVPKSLRHQFTFAVADKTGTQIERSFEGIPVAVDSQPAITLQAPLRGAGWVSFNAFGAADHRRSFLAVDGEEHLAQRFAIDWAQLGPNGLPNKGKGERNSDFFSYGQPVLAVAHATVEAIADGFADNVGTSTQAQRAVSLQNIAGNYVVLNLGSGRYALYAHLQPHSIQVHAGQSVEAGTVLAKLGNSGNSDAPHLHFQVMNGSSPLASEGLPYEIDSYTQVGVIQGDQVDRGVPWKPDASSIPVPMVGSFPSNQAVVVFK